MTKLMQPLFTFTMEHKGNVAYLPEYRQTIQRAERKETALRQQLGAEHQQLLDELLSELGEQAFLEQEHLFLATIALCRELMANVP